ncbi:MAG: hypothetical protein JRJ84_11370 [Deltaproteobacteria bacterium]|nr:hypothetical protein [Deltaproteobacteria bacterium]
MATLDGYACTACPSGWDDVNGDGTQCQHFDECALGTDNCAPEVTCIRSGVRRGVRCRAAA